MRRPELAVVLLAALAFTAPAHAMEFCDSPVRVTCVVDGDTFWLSGEKIRIEGIDAPESGGKCFAERDLAARSAERLRQLLSGAGVTIERGGKDQYGRTLATVTAQGIDVGEKMIAEGVARRWKGRRENWCS